MKKQWNFHRRIEDWRFKLVNRRPKTKPCRTAFTSSSCPWLSVKIDFGRLWG